MTKSLTLVAALIASAAYGGAALAAGDYYDGVSSETARNVDHVQTNSVGDRGYAAHQDVPQAVNSGDYYDGANRPQ